MKTVWVVEEDSYSDHRVVGVFTSEANARLVADRIGGDASVAEWPMDPAVNELRKGMRQYYVTMLRDGSTERVTAADGFCGYGIGGSARIWWRTQAPAYKGTGVPDALSATVWARDERHAVKVANEKRVQIIAAGDWPSTESTPHER